jgi:GT2 family glycosyltransferase
MKPPYSVIIRSVRDNEYLRQALAALASQTHRPSEIVIVIPDDVDQWRVVDATVRFAMATRGMVSQRAAGIREAQYPLLILIDDDIVLAPDAVERLFDPLVRRNVECVVPYWPEAWPKKPAVRWWNKVWGIAIPRKEGGITYTNGGGFFYPLSAPPAQGWVTLGGPGGLIALKKDFAIENSIFGDLDLQNIGAYALREDAQFILSIAKKGGRCLMIPRIVFKHMGGTTRLSPGRLRMHFKAQIYNQYIFWRKYIRPECNTSVFRLLKSQLAIIRYMLGICSFGIAMSLRSRSYQPIQGIAAGGVFLLKATFVPRVIASARQVNQ